MRRVLTILAALLFASGGGLIWYAFHGGSQYDEAPSVTTTFRYDQTVPSGPVSAVIDGQTITAKTMKPGWVFIPAMNVHAPLSKERVVGGSMTLPNDVAVHVGINIDTQPLVAEQGATVLAGHVSSRGIPGVLHDLGTKITPGARAWTKDFDGQLREWVAVGLDQYVKADLPDDTFAVAGDRRLFVVTCGGPVVTYPDGSRHYRDNVRVAFAPAAP